MDRIKTIKPGDLDFVFSTDITQCNRAGLEISPDCPASYRRVIQEAVANKWLVPVAYMKESEYVWEELSQ
jgi:hypothetical protein